MRELAPRAPLQASHVESYLLARVAGHARFLMLCKGWGWADGKGLHGTFTVRLRDLTGEWCSANRLTPWEAAEEAAGRLEQIEAIEREVLA